MPGTVQSVISTWGIVEVQLSVLHHENHDHQTLLKIIVSQGSGLKTFRYILLEMERSCHDDLTAYTKCLKQILGTSDITLEAVHDGRAIYKPSELTKIWTWVKLILQFLIPFTILIFDIVLDVILVKTYWDQYSGKLQLNLLLLA